MGGLSMCRGKAYTAIKWLSVSQGHFYNVLREAKKKYQK